MHKSQKHNDNFFGHGNNNKNDKLNCNVNTFGNNFSVGQKQLICFARILLKKPKIIFMDEATSNIDNYTDKIILNLLLNDNNTKNITIICIELFAFTFHLISPLIVNVADRF